MGSSRAHSQSDLSESCRAEPIDWRQLPTDLILEVAHALLREKCDVCPLLETCRSWRDSAAHLHLVTALQPLGPFNQEQLERFTAVRSVDFAARGYSHNITDTQLSQTCAALGGRLERLDISGAFQVSPRGLQSLWQCGRLRDLSLGEMTLRDDDLAVLRFVPRLRRLSLRRCMYLQGAFLPALPPALPALQALDLAGCGLTLHLHPAARGSLSRLSSLTQVDLSGGNGVTDQVLQELAHLRRLRSLRIRGAQEVGDQGVAHLAGGACATALQDLDLGGVSRLSEACWEPLSRLPSLRRLNLDSVPHLLVSALVPEHFQGALWRWRHLTHLSLAGASPHPAKLRLVAEICGATLAHLDIGVSPYSEECCACCALGAGQGAPDGGSHPDVPPWGAAGAARGEGREGAGGSSGAHPRSRNSACYQRLSPVQLKDLTDALGLLRTLRAFRAAGSGLPLEATLALLCAAAGSLTWLDLAGCSMEFRQLSARPPSAWQALGASVTDAAPAAPAAAIWQQQGTQQPASSAVAEGRGTVSPNTAARLAVLVSATAAGTAGDGGGGGSSGTPVPAGDAAAGPSARGTTAGHASEKTPQPPSMATGTGAARPRPLLQLQLPASAGPAGGDSHVGVSRGVARALHFGAPPLDQCRAEAPVSSAGTAGRAHPAMHAKQCKALPAGTPCPSAPPALPPALLLTPTAPASPSGQEAAERFSQALARASHTLRGLDLSGCSALTDHHLGTLGTLSALRRLSLAHCKRVTDATLWAACAARGGSRDGRPGSMQQGSVGEPAPETCTGPQIAEHLRQGPRAWPTVAAAAGAAAASCSASSPGISEAADRQGPGWRFLELGGSGITDASLPLLAALRGVRHLSLERCAVTSAGIAHLLVSEPPLHGATVGATSCKDAASSHPACCSTTCQGGDAHRVGTAAPADIQARGVGGVGCRPGMPGSGCSTSCSTGLGRSLRGLDLRGCSGVDDAVLQAVAAGAPGLRWLRVSSCRAVGEAGAAAMSHQLRRLTRLEVARCPRAITDTTVVALCHNLTQLTHLDLGDSPLLTMEGLHGLGRLQCLVRLDLTCCRGLSDTEAREKLPRLTSTNVQMAGGGRSPTGSPLKL